MEGASNKKYELLDKLNALEKKQEMLSDEIGALKISLQKIAFDGESGKEVVLTEQKLPAPVATVSAKENKPPNQFISRTFKKVFPSSAKNNIEKFIGENLISVIGVVILIIGVGIGVKYAIEHQMISPLTRIIIGYLIAIGLLGLAIKLKPKYESYSAVLLSGALAIMYFLTYAAFDFYDLIPKLVAFGLMVVLTLFTTFASLKYNKQVIAHIGFVGAYAVPFLLSDGTGSVLMLFIYITIVNLGILSVSLKKYWKSLYYTAFVFTWLIFIAAGQKLDSTDDFATLFTFLTLFYLIFYAVFIGYKLIKKETFKKFDIVLMMTNSFVYYGLGYAILDDASFEINYLGLFTLFNAVIHFGVAYYLNKQKLADRNLFYLIIGLVLTFITIAIPVQLNGHWVTLLWIGEAALLFLIGRTKQIAIYEKLSYPLIAIAFFSILQDWKLSYNAYYDIYPEGWLTPFFNSQFLSSLLVVSGFGAINYFNRKYKLANPVFAKSTINDVLNFAIPTSFLLLLFITFLNEINNYWDQVYFNSKVMIPYDDGSGGMYSEFNSSIKNIGEIWGYIYAMFFLIVLSIINNKILKNRLLALINLGINTFVALLFLTSGLFILSELRGDYLAQEMAEYFIRGWFYIGIRYVALIGFAALIFVSYQYTKQKYLTINLKPVFAIVFYVTVLWVLSSELIHWMDYAGSAQSYKLGLSILWGVYSLLLIVIGIFRNYKPIRFGAMGLFGLTLLKLFFYDISHLDTIAKTIVFIVLGVLLLLISFLYNKYKSLIFEENENKE